MSVVALAGFRNTGAPVKRGNVNCGRRIRFPWHSAEKRSRCTRRFARAMARTHTVGALTRVSHDEALTSTTTTTKVEQKKWLPHELLRGAMVNRTKYC